MTIIDAPLPAVRPARTILCGLDETPHDERATRTAFALARRMDARVMLVHADSLSRVAASERADLLVVGAHDTSMPRRMLHGSVAARLLDDAPCPVVAVSPHAHDGPSVGGPLVCGVSSSERSLRAVAVAASMANALRVSLLFVHVVAPHHDPRSADLVLERATDRIPAPVPAGVDTRVSRGDASIELNALVRRLHPTLVVVGRRRPGGIRQRIAGSVALHLAGRGAAPMMAAP